MSRQYRVCILAVTALLTVATASVYAEDPNPLLEITRADLADLLAKSAELTATKRQVLALEATVAALERHVAAQAALIKMQDDMLARQERITGLADEEARIEREGRARERKDAGRGSLALRVQARAGAGALLGVAVAPIFPPAVVIGPLLGALGGLIEHWLVD